MGIIFSDRDARRIESAVLAHENRTQGGDQANRDGPRRFFQQAPLRLFKLLGSAKPPESVNAPRAIAAQPFLGDTEPELAYRDERDENGKLLPVEETIQHGIPGLYLCDGSLAWCVWAYGAWRIIQAETWPVSVQQIRADGFPTGSASCSLTIDGEAFEFELTGNATAAELLEAVREHPRLARASDVHAIGGPLDRVDINLTFGPAVGQVAPLQIDSSAMSPGHAGLRVSLISPSWSYEVDA